MVQWAPMPTVKEGPAIRAARDVDAGEHEELNSLRQALAELQQEVVAIGKDVSGWDARRDLKL